MLLPLLELHTCSVSDANSNSQLLHCMLAITINYCVHILPSEVLLCWFIASWVEFSKDFCLQKFLSFVQ